MLQNWLIAFIDDMANRLEYEQERKEILQYAMIITVNTLLGFASIIMVGSILGVGKLALVAALTGGLLRTYSGGAHATSPGRCAAIGTIAYVSLGIVTKLLADDSILIYFLLTFVFGGWSIWKYAPAEAPGKPLGSYLHRQKLRQRAVITLGVWATAFFLIWFLWGASPWLLASCLGALWQSITVTPIGHKITHKVDYLLQKI